jgi:prepilin-type N-terminal cleavage/methylation domain-containing protein
MSSRLLLAPRRRRQSGLTLIEMLVAMVILGFVLTLVSQAVQQVSQLVRAAEATTRDVTSGWRGAWALQPSLSNLVWPVEQLDDGFKGTPTRVEGYSNTPLSGTSVGVQPFVLELRRSAGASGQTEVWATGEGQRRGEFNTQMVAKLDGRVAFAFADESGHLSPVWPLATNKPVGTDEPSLPQAIVLQNQDDNSSLMWFGFLGEKLRPRPMSKAFFE